MNPKENAKLERLKAVIPENLDPKDPKERVKLLLKEVRGAADVLKDVGLEVEIKGAQEEIIQQILVEAEHLLDVAMDIARKSKIEFSFLELDVHYLQKGEKGKFIHPDTIRADRLESQRDDWDGSSRDCPGG